ncbi:alpha/beta fold hydrolase [Deinococcus deserti]|uniref:Putative prolyl aminopeptidase n=1 Tax=Deinococcus deserti (strain DSM 17065 / CIP 109153 / LMG 22923 / VCD115) TaxID=546414 RepID=C1D3N2_DEIDV|nr:alpha/beta fold hydrolase [Deinococcus deserti]ACO48111.1 putative prolyl aminopeptidase [Deinococcus deserti VCD115]
MSMTPGDHTFTTDGLNLAYRVAGRGEALVVQPPGWGIGAGLYERSFGPLERHFTVVYLHPRGSGRSQSPSNPEDINVGRFIEDLDALRSHLGLETIRLIGHSHGGYIALNYALRYPRHLSHLVVVDAQLGVKEPGEDMQRTLPVLALDPRCAEAVKAFSGPLDLKTDEDVSVFLHRIAPLYFRDPEGEGAAMFREYARSNRISLVTSQAAGASDGRFLVRDRLGEITVPTLVLVGRHDFICSPVQADIIHDGIQGSQLEVFEDSGHLPWMEEPEPYFDTVTQFLHGERRLGSATHSAC